MVKGMAFDRGSKRRLRQIRWKIGEVASLAVLTAIAIGAGILLLAAYHVDHFSEPSKIPEVRDATRP